MRQLKTNDVFKMSRILGKIKIDISGTDEEIGARIIKQIGENAHLAQNEINDFLGDLVGMTGDEFGELPLKESIAIIKEFKELDGISDFFKSAGLLTS